MPARIPESKKKLTGTARHDRAPGKQRRRTDKEAQPTRMEPPPSVPRGTLWGIPLIPPPGSDLDPCVWQECACAVNQLRCATTSDSPAFHELVRALALLRKAAAELQVGGFTYVAASGARKASPAVSAWATASKTAGALMDRFGLSPSMRERVGSIPSASEQDQEDEAEKFLFGEIGGPPAMARPPTIKEPKVTARSEAEAGGRE